MNVPEDKLLDKRLIRRHIERGLVTQSKWDETLASLPDIQARSSVVSVEVSSVGVHDVKAKDTGEHDS